MLCKTLASALCGALIAGCAVGPNFTTPESPDIHSYTAAPLPKKTVSSDVPGGKAQEFLLDQKIPEQWWTLFRSPGLDRLIRQGLSSNPSTAAAQAALRQVRENYYARHGTYIYPTVDAKLSAEREHISGAFFGQTTGSGVTFNLFNASVSVSYLLDIFGGVRRQLESLQAEVDYQQFETAATYLTLTANIVTTAIQEASLRAQIKATQEIISDEENQLRLIQRQFELGAIARTDVLAQQTQLAQTRSTLPPLERSLYQTRHQLAVLVGRFPSESGELPEFNFEGLELPTELPLVVPSELVRQRPDIRASTALLHAASAQIGVATANLYPQLNLTGGVGWQANKIENLFSSETFIWNIGAGLLQPIFRGGALRAQRRAAVAAFEQSLALYQQTVLQAFLNVADVLRALEADARELKAQADVENAAAENLRLIKIQFRAGAISYLNLLDAQRQYQQARINLVRAQATRYADTAALFQALGGGWWYPVSQGAQVTQPAAASANQNSANQQ